ncbi:primosomal protein N' [Rhodococcoides corynebacterioides]|uniref:Probable replication restart protein PriA n=1 Tax=Rhodococcoides corynebacterioides TaxID=53972 RepID=A0ABS7P1Q6_9NOCA|nr:primosomal protein N' [Rhodococcus corynebacterioides]MBY6366230.1 primosomal protein N' [Rhodococcus corynebacterioides]MBY6406859.1 primosomal protein N' [Rhodococcus corynebacterioides]
MTGTPRPAERAPIARVVPLLALAHLDRDFDYLVPVEWDEAAQPGVRVRVRFAGRLVDGFLIERRATTDHPGKLGFLDKVVSPEVVLTPEVADLVTAVAARYAGTRSDVLRLAVPPRHARVEAQARTSGAPPAPTVTSDGWARYRFGSEFLVALTEGRAPRAVWQALPGEDWPARLADLAAATVAAGRGVMIVVPDQRDLDRVEAACHDVLDPAVVSVLSAGLGPAERYRRWLAVARGAARVVVGTRSAAFAPVHDLALTVVWDDGDESLTEPRAPYPHARDVALLRAHRTGTAAVVGGFARTAEAQALVESGWARDLLAARDTVRAAAPRITALADSEHALVRDPAARAARIPAVAFAAARTALAAGRPVLVQVPRRGYVPSLACGKCRTPARCRRCHGPLALPSAPGADGVGSPTCRWCGTADAAYSCPTCGSRALRATVIGAGRTAEELGRAFSGVTVRQSGGSSVLASVPAGPSLVVATVGAEPVVPGGYGAALLLDGWAMLGRADLRAAEQTLRRWMAVAASVIPASDGGEVVVVAEADLPVVQALIRWDPAGHAAAELAERAEVGFPPAVHMAAVDGAPDAVRALLDAARLPAETVTLGPVDLPAGERPPVGSDAADEATGPIERVLLRVPRRSGSALARALADARAVVGAKKSATSALRVQVDPLRIG